MQLPAYTATSSFPGTATANLAVDSGGNVITVSTTGGSVFPFVGNAVITGSLTVTQPIYVPINGGMYFQGGDDAALYDVNQVNTMGIYGVQNSTMGAIKLGSAGPTLHGSGSHLTITGSLFVSGGSTLVNQIYGGLRAYGGGTWYDSNNSLAIDVDSRLLLDGNESASVDFGNGLLYEPVNGIGTVEWFGTRLYDSAGNASMHWSDRNLLDTSGITTVDWNGSALKDSSGIDSILWNDRQLTDITGNTTLLWDAPNQFQSILSSYYYSSYIPSSTQENFIDESAGNAIIYAGEVIEATLDISVATNDLVYLATDGKWYPVTQSIDQCSRLLGVCVNAGKTYVLLEGTLTVTSNVSNTDSPFVQALAPGRPIFIRDSNGNLMSTTVPSTSGNYVRALGHAYLQSPTNTDYWVMKFRPSMDWYIIG
jgi:hypothetical protein